MNKVVVVVIILHKGWCPSAHRKQLTMSMSMMSISDQCVQSPSVFFQQSTGAKTEALQELGEWIPDGESGL